MITAELDRFLDRLQTQASGNREMRDAIHFYRCLLPAMLTAREGIPPPALNERALNERALALKLSAGIPLLVDEVVEIRPADSQRVFAALCEAALQGCLSAQGCAGEPEGAEMPPDQREIRDKIAAVQNALARAAPKIIDIETELVLGAASGALNALDPRALFFMIANDDTDSVQQVAREHQLDPPVLLMLAQNAFKVFLRAWRADLEPRLDLSAWKRGLCPICGAPPGLAEIQGSDSARHLRCLACGADWPYPNLTCAFCGSDDHTKLGMLQLESQFRRLYAHTCETCGRYIKTIVTFEPTPADLLIIADLETLQLDQIARECGYT